MHPYKALPPHAFWKTAVSEKSHLDFFDIYRKKFSISQTDRIVTAGSCFAQHIARRLRASGFNYRDYEPAPSELPKKFRQEFGYEIFSARYNNIYTARQLLQTFQRAFGYIVPMDSMWHHNGRFFDPYRPTVEPNGFASPEELQASRHSHYAAVRRVFQESDLFIFTLGLTEAWIAKEDGSVYPLCPGTAAGEFDPTSHIFHNFSFVETLEDLQALINAAREVNPGLRFLLTVSPVPLTATASGGHVLVATTYSKSVLRAVAGELVMRHDFVDYFPSYELVASAPIRGMLYDPNLRSVTDRGVDLVMTHFFAQHRGSATRAATSADQTTTDAGPERDHLRSPYVGEDEEVSEPALMEDSGDVVCEELLLAETR